MALTSFDHRIELAVGFSVDRLWRDHDRGLLDEQTARLATAHRTLADAERSVTFYRVLLQRLASGEYAIDESLFPRIDRTVEQFKRAVTCREARARDVVDALEPIEAQTARNPAASTELKAREIALLLAISQGAKLHEHLLTQRLSVVTASGTRVTQQDFERLERAGLCCPALKMPTVAAFTVPMLSDEDAPPAGAKRGGSSARCRCYRQGAGGISRPPR